MTEAKKAPMETSLSIFNMITSLLNLVFPIYRKNYGSQKFIAVS